MMLPSYSPCSTKSHASKDSGVLRVVGLIRFKETGLVEYRFRPDSFEVRHVIAVGQVIVGMDELLPPKQG